MSFPTRYFPIVLTLLLLCGYSSSYAGWNKIKQLSTSQPASCGFFFDANHGMIGTGYRRVSNTRPQIYLTNDGGTSWALATTPLTVSGAITSIMMKDANIGYASFYSSGGDNNIWKTTDGGVNWSDQTGQNFGTAACVYATSKALIETTWGIAGGRSLDDGATFNQVFQNARTNSSNGIDFGDDLNGIVTMGPNNNLNRSATKCWFTQNGGVNWNEGDVLPEAWGVYALKGTQTVFAMPEGYGANPNTSVFRSLDGGRSWNVIHDFTGADRHFFTGHIAGGHNTIYVQTEGTFPAGLYRTDDLGITWKNIGGPSNGRDTRFVVTGCNSETVYAFDSLGGIWKTTDGGDGTLTAAPNGAGNLSLGMDSVFISGSCVPARGYITFKNLNCISFSIDSVSFSPDTYHEFSLDTMIGSSDLYPNFGTALPVKFQTDSSLTRRTNIHIHGHYGSRIIDTIIVLIAKHATITGPLLALSADSIFISSTCQPARGYIALSNRNCNSVIIDSLSFSPDPYKEFSLDTLKSGLNILSNASVGIPILFQCDSDKVRNTSVHIHAHSGNIIIDTIIIVRARHSTISGPLVSMPFDSVYMETRYCQPLRRYIDLSNLNCNDLIIDSVILSPQYPELVIDTSQNPNLFLSKFSSGRGIPVFFQTDSNLTRHSTMRIVGHSLDRKIDTTIILVAKHSTAPEPYLVDLQKTKVGDKVMVPVYLRITQDSFTIKHYSFHLSYDGDILTPKDPIFQTIGTLSASGTVKIGSSEPNGILCTVDFTKAITQNSDLTQPLIYLWMGVTLSRNMSCPVRLDTFAISNTAPLPLCTIPVTKFIIDPECGDTILSRFMTNGAVPGFLSVHPNPNSGAEVVTEVLLSERTGLHLEISDARGVVIRKMSLGSRYEKGLQSLKINMSDISNGTYFLRIEQDNGSSCSARIVISK